jgi:two-component system nitrogen regulation response regulator GlnG
MEVPVKIPEPDELEVEPGHHDVLLGRSPPMLEVYKDIGRIASQDVAVLICGESGTGKELVARAIYQHSPRNGQCFLAVNCAAITDTLLESELFGHEKGAFTGADRRRIGKFEQCNGGTIFLDEVGDMSPATQSKVLRLLQDQQCERVGGSETIETDVRMISATNRHLERMIDAGRFRADLYHRLHGYRIDLPALRERGEDLLLLIRYFLTKFRRDLGKEVEGVSPAALELLIHYSWPGNVRELQTVLRTAVLKTSGPVLAPEVLPELVNLPDAAPAHGNGAVEANSIEAFVKDRERAGSHNLYAETLERMEQYLVTQVLRETHGNQSQAAERLGITRGSLRNKIRALGISIGHVVEPHE